MEEEELNEEKSKEDIEKELKRYQMSWFWITGLGVVLTILLLSIPDIISD